MKRALPIALVVACSAVAGWGQPPDAWARADRGDDENTSQAKKQQSVPPLDDDADHFWSRKYMTGDWDGARSEWTEEGFSFELRLTQK